MFFFSCQKKIESITSTKLDEAMVVNSILEIPHVEFNMFCQKLPYMKTKCSCLFMGQSGVRLPFLIQSLRSKLTENFSSSSTNYCANLELHILSSQISHHHRSCYCSQYETQSKFVGLRKTKSWTLKQPETKIYHIFNISAMLYRLERNFIDFSSTTQFAC